MTLLWICSKRFGFSGSDEQLEKIQDWLKYFDKNAISYFSKGGGGADIGPLHRQTGTPMFGLSIDGQKYLKCITPLKMSLSWFTLES